MRNSRVVFGGLLFLTAILSAEIIHVDALKGQDDWPGTEKQPKQSIGAAIGAASDLDEILVREGVYQGAGNRNMPFGAKNIIVRSESGPDVTVIDAQGLGRIFNIANAPASAMIQGFTIQNGYADKRMDTGGGGAGIRIADSGMTIQDCVIRNCTGIDGVGLGISGSSGTQIINCTLQWNIAEDYNTACSGAGASLLNCTGVEFSGCRFIGNRNQPGFISHGGAISARSSDASFTNCLFEGNYAEGSGAVAHAQGKLTFDRCTFYGNFADSHGGCFMISYEGDVLCTNSIFLANEADYLADIAQVIGNESVGGVFRYAFCDIDPAGINAAGACVIVEDLGGCFNADPLFAAVGYWDVRAGEWVAGDYHLQSMVGRLNSLGKWVVDAAHSPCIDAGDPSADFSAEPAHNGGRLNMGFFGGTGHASQGAYCSAPIPADLSGDCRVDIADFALFASAWMTCTIVPDSYCW